MRRYEQIYILRPSLSEDEITKVIENTGKIINDEGGTIISIDKWGMKKLAYPIQKEVQGYYVFCDFATTPAAVAEVERKFRIEDSVLKYLTIKLSTAISSEEISAAKEEATAKASRLESEEETESTTEAETKVKAEVKTEVKTAPAETTSKETD